MNRHDGTRDAAILRAIYRNPDELHDSVGGDKQIGLMMNLKKLSSKERERMFGPAAKNGTKGAADALKFARKNLFALRDKTIADNDAFDQRQRKAAAKPKKPVAKAPRLLGAYSRSYYKKNSE